LLDEQGRRPPPSLADVFTVAESKQTTREKRGEKKLKHKSRQLTEEEEEEEANVKRRKRKQPTTQTTKRHKKKEVFGGKNVCMRLFDARNMLHNTQKKKAGGIARHVRDTFVFNTWLFSV
jgi:hypothetical protein